MRYVLARQPGFKLVVVHDTAPAVTFSLAPQLELVVIEGLAPASQGGEGWIELRNRNFQRVRIMNAQIAALEWQYNRIGGCGSFSLELKERYDALRDLVIVGDFDVAVYLPTIGGTTLLWYRGYVDRVDENLETHETVRITGYGYSRQLNRVVVAATYADMEVSEIARDILATYVAPKTGILPTQELIATAGFVAGTLVFNTTADKAIKTLADLVGYEFGVDKERRLYFVPAGATITNRHFIGGDVVRYNSPRAYDDIVNRLYVQGKDGLRVTVESVDSQTDHGIREAIVLNGSIASEADARKYGSALLKDKARPVRRASIQIRSVNEPVERNVPMGRVAISGKDTSRSVLYGGPKYGEAIYGGPFQAQPENVTYAFRHGMPSVKYTLGNPKDETSRQLKAIEFQLDALREI